MSTTVALHVFQDGDRVHLGVPVSEDDETFEAAVLLTLSRVSALEVAEALVRATDGLAGHERCVQVPGWAVPEPEREGDR